MPHSKFNDRVIKIVCLAPLGSIVSYGADGWYSKSRIASRRCFEQIG